LDVGSWGPDVLNPKKRNPRWLLMPLIDLGDYGSARVSANQVLINART
jgi:hypothetical protein